MGWLLRTKLRDHERARVVQQRYRQLFDEAVNGMAILSADARVMTVNRRYADMLGYAETELEGKDFFSLKHPDDRSDSQSTVAAILSTNQPSVTRERRYMHRDGSIVWVRSSLSELFSGGDGKRLLLVVADDITADKAGRDRLRRSESLAHNAALMAGIGGWALGLDPVRVELGGGLEAWVGRSAAPVTLAALAQVFPAASRRRLLPWLQRCRRSGASFDVEVTVRSLAGEARTLRLIGQAIVRNGVVEAIEGAWHDVTDTRRRDEALRRSEQRFRAIAHVTSDAFWEWDSTTGAIWRSEDAGDRLRLTRDAQPHCEFWFDLIHPEDRDAVRAGFTDALRSGALEWSAEYRYRRADGGHGHLADRARIVRDDDGQVLRVVGGMLDISERRRVQQAVMQMAASVPAGSSAVFFDMLLRNLVAAVGADGGCIARIRTGDRDRAETIAALANGLSLPKFRYEIAGTPCVRMQRGEDCLIPAGLQREFPSTSRLGDLGAQAYAGAPLVDSSDNLIGVIFVLFREPLLELELTRSVLRVFAARATAEIERTDTHLRLREQAELLDYAQEAIAVLDLGLKVRFWSRGAERAYRIPAALALGAPVAHHYAEPATLAMALPAVLETGAWSGECTQVRGDGESFVLEERWSLVRDDSGAPHSILRVGNDVTERKAREEHIRHLAYYDHLTGLPNRRLFLDRLQQAQTRAVRSKRHGALLFLDMDNFKGLNDTHGHHAGDDFLRLTAERLTSCVRAADTVARLGGDEFVLVLENLDEGSVAAQAQAHAVAGLVREKLGEPVQLGDCVWCSTASIGLVLFGPAEVPLESLLQQADGAMYADKANGRNGARFADELAPGASADQAVFERVVDQGGVRAQAHLAEDA
ncbi:MAG: PAS domain S-box protein [Telluria sp.]